MVLSGKGSAFCPCSEALFFCKEKETISSEILTLELPPHRGLKSILFWQGFYDPLFVPLFKLGIVIDFMSVFTVCT